MRPKKAQSVDVEPVAAQNLGRRTAIKVDVVQSTEAIDIDAWLDRYIRAIATAQSSRPLAA